MAHHGSPRRAGRRPLSVHPDPTELRDLAVAVATEAGELLAAALDGERTVETKTSATDMVTEMDRASEALLVERLRAARPDDGILGEEGTDDPGTTGVRWIVDPLDGTTNYLYRYPGWNVSVGVELHGEPVAGAVVAPALGEVFAAARGAGATRNGRPLRLGPPAPLETLLLGTGFNYDPARRVGQAVAVSGLIGRIRDIRRGGAAAVDLCGVACGRLDAYAEHGLAPWDRVAGGLIATEAGARFAIVDGGPLGADCTIAAHPERFDELVGLLIEVGLLGSR